MEGNWNHLSQNYVLTELSMKRLLSDKIIFINGEVNAVTLLKVAYIIECFFFSENLDKEDWLGARNFCRMRCMDTVSLETPQENEWMKNTIAKEHIAEIWTSGRICDFKVRRFNCF